MILSCARTGQGQLFIYPTRNEFLKSIGGKNYRRPINKSVLKDCTELKV